MQMIVMHMYLLTHDKSKRVFVYFINAYYIRLSSEI